MDVDPNSVMMSESPSAGGVLRDASWTIPLVAIASINVVSISLFEAFILAKTLVNDGGRHFGGGSMAVSRRHFFLGQVLLLGLFGSSLIGLIFVAPTSPFVCGVTRQLGVALVGATIFASLLVKCVFLVSLHGGVYLPSAYLALLLLFAVAVQLALSVQWLFLRPPDTVFVVVQTLVDGAANIAHSHIDDGDDDDAVAVTFSMVAPRPMCNTSFAGVLSGLTYVLMLLIGVLVLSIKSRRIRDNYRESVYIVSSTCCVLVVWTVSVLVAFINGTDYEDSCLAFALEATSSIVFLVMFAPKGRQLAAMGREGLYVEDQRDVDNMSNSCMPPQQSQPLPTAATTPPHIYSTMRHPGFYHYPTMASVHHRRPTFVACDSSDAIYRISNPAAAVPDHHKCHNKKIPTSFGVHCRRHVVGPIYKTNYGQTLPNNSMLY